MHRTRVWGNTGGFDGASANIEAEAGDLVVVDSEVSDIVPGQLIATSVSFGPYDGIRQHTGNLTLIRSTIADHNIRLVLCGSRGCGIVDVPGDGIETDGSADIFRSTFAANTHDITGTGTVRVQGSSVTTCASPVLSLGYNRDADGSCLGAGTTGDLTSAAPVAGALDFHGGPTRNYVPLSGSVLVDAIPAGTPTLCDGALATDQRGQPIPAGGACDIGSVERQPSDP
jgi:hypothetical protein